MCECMYIKSKFETIQQKNYQEQLFICCYLLLRATPTTITAIKATIISDIPYSLAIVTVAAAATDSECYWNQSNWYDFVFFSYFVYIFLS